MTIEEALSVAVDCQDACDLLMRESARLGSALHKHLPQQNLMIYTNKLHVYFDLGNLRRELTAVTNQDMDPFSTGVIDLYYADEDSLSEFELQERLMRFYSHIEILGNRLLNMMRSFEELGSVPMIVKYCIQHLGIEIMFFKKDLARAGFVIA